jgi:hypothetical protein
VIAVVLDPVSTSFILRAVGIGKDTSRAFDGIGDLFALIIEGLKWIVDHPQEAVTATVITGAVVGSGVEAGRQLGRRAGNDIYDYVREELFPEDEDEDED